MVDVLENAANPGPRRVPPIYVGVVLCIAGLCVAAALWRVGVYAALDPMIDQIFYIQWIKRLRLADHVLPAAGDGVPFLTALIQDEQSLFNIFLRQVYAAHVHVFTLFSVIWLYAWSLVAGFSIDGQVGISIWTASAAVFVLSMANLGLFRADEPARAARLRCAAALLCAALILINGFMADFAATGPHNLSGLTLFCALLVTMRWLRAGNFDAGYKATGVVMAVQVVALYSYYSNVFLLPSATFLAILFEGGAPWNRKIRRAAAYAVLIVLIMLPPITVLVIDKAGLAGVSSPATFFDVGQQVIVSSGSAAQDIVQRLYRWLAFHRSMLGGAVLVIGIIGAFLIWLREGVSLFAFVLLSHLLATAVLNGFGYFQKTSGYIIPILLLCTAYLTVRALTGTMTPPLDGRRRLAAMLTGLGAAVVCGAYFYTQIDRFDAFPRRAEMADLVAKGPVLRGMFAEIDGVLRRGDTVVPGSDYIGQSYMAYSGRAGVDVRVFRSLDTMTAKLKAGELDRYIARRGLTAPAPASVALLLTPSALDGPGASEIARLLGPEGLGHPGPFDLHLVRSWPGPKRASPLTPLGVYQLRRDE